MAKEYKKVILKNGEIRYVFDVSLGIVNGKRKRTTVRARTIKEGRLKVAELTANLKEITSRDSITFSEAFKVYYKQCEKRLAVSTLRCIKNAYDSLEIFYDRKLVSITPNEIEDWLFSLDHSNSTNNVYLAKLKAFLNFCVKREYLTLSPARNISKLKEKKVECDFITEDEMIMLYNQIENRVNKISLLILFYTGLRIGELAGLSLSDMDDDDHMIHLHHTRKQAKISDEFKNPQSKRTVPCPRKLYDMVKQFMIESEKEFPFFNEYRNFYYALNKISKPVLGRTIHPHTLRHSYASMMINAGVDIYTLSRLLGHQSIETTTKVYAHLYKDKLIEISEKMELNGVIK